LSLYSSKIKILLFLKSLVLKKRLKNSVEKN